MDINKCQIYRHIGATSRSSLQHVHPKNVNKLHDLMNNVSDVEEDSAPTVCNVLNNRNQYNPVLYLDNL